MVGNPPHITVWLNGKKITDFKDTANHAARDAEDGMIAVQVHSGKRWVEDGYHRFRNIAVKELGQLQPARSRPMPPPSNLPFAEPDPNQLSWQKESAWRRGASSQLASARLILTLGWPPFALPPLPPIPPLLLAPPVTPH